MIEVGEYVRTKNGFILKLNKNNIVNIFNFDDENVYIDLEKEGLYFEEDKILKHSKNIIDLIQKDDFVNGCKVYGVDKNGITVYQKVEHSDTDYNFISVDEIKSIVTKEQFKNIEYIVED